MSLPTQIRKRDGRLVSFQPEKISRTLFAITEELGSPDSFLAHELTDGVLHFLKQDEVNEITSAQLADLVAKVVRELGHPLIAKCYEDSLGRPRPPRSAATQAPHRRDDLISLHRPVFDDYWIARDQFIDHSLNCVYPRDLVAAHRDGLIELLDLDHPPLLSASVLCPTGPLPLEAWSLFETVRDARRTTGWLIAIDAMEYSLAQRPSVSLEFIQPYLRQLQRSLELNHLFGVVNLNSLEPPPWAAQSTGPLFPTSPGTIERGQLDLVADQLMEAYLPSRPLSINWHISARDLASDAQPRLERMIAKALTCPKIEFVFDRPRRPIYLAPGLERGGPPVLGHLRLVLNRFVEMLGGGPLDHELYLKKVASLARFARTAGYVRQDHLRRHADPELQSGFILERARLLIFHKTLVEAAMYVLGPTADEGSIVDLAQRTLDAIRGALEDNPSRVLATQVDWVMTWDHPAGDEYMMLEKLGEGNLMWQRQLRHADRLAGDGNGILTINLNLDNSDGIRQVIEVLRAAWRTDVSRVHFNFQQRK